MRREREMLWGKLYTVLVTTSPLSEGQRFPGTQLVITAAMECDSSKARLFILLYLSSTYACPSKRQQHCCTVQKICT